MTKLLIIFIALNISNVVVQTMRSLFTIHGNKYTASMVNALAYGLYTVVIVYTVCDLPLWEKVVIVALTNLIGVFVVKLVEEKMQKDKLWKIEVTVKVKDYPNVIEKATESEIPFSYQYICGNNNKYYRQVNFYCETQEESITVKKILNEYDCKYFVSESKSLVK